MDIYYGWSGELTGWHQKYQIFGLKDSYLKYDYKENHWVAGIYSSPYTFAITNETDNKSVLPFGTYNWYVFNDTCNDEGNSLVKKTKLSLSRCGDNKFTCQSGGTW